MAEDRFAAPKFKVGADDVEVAGAVVVVVAGAVKLNPPPRGVAIAVGAGTDAAVDTAAVVDPALPKLNPNDGAEGCVLRVPSVGAGVVVVAAVEIPVSDVNPCAGAALVVEPAAGAPNDKGLAAPVVMDNDDGAGAVKFEVAPPLGAPPNEKLLDGVVDAPNAGGGAVVVAVGVVPNENPVAAGVAVGAAPNENPDPVDDAGLEAPKENPPMAGVGAAPGAVVVGAAAGDPKENAPVGLDAPPNPPNPDIFFS